MRFSRPSQWFRWEAGLPGRRAIGLVLTDAERAELEGLAACRSTALRARIVLACADGEQNEAVAAGLGACQHTVGKRRARFAEHRVQRLRDEPRPGAPRTVEDERVEALVTATLESVPQGRD